MTRSDLEESLKVVLEHMDARFAAERQWAEGRFAERKWTEERFARLEDAVQDQGRYLGGLLEEIRSQNRAVIEAVQSERQGRQREVQSLGDEVCPRLDALELVVREHSARFDSKADRSLEKRVEALEHRPRR